MSAGLDDIDRRIVVATQAGLPLVERPYHAVADEVGIAPEEVMERMRRLLDAGAIRRIGVVPDHYALGYRFNGMTVWEVADADIREAGRRVGALPFVSHCYHRPPHPPEWPYTLFAMVHGRDEATARAHVDEIARTLGALARSHLVLFSTRILKKTGLRL
ncbi:MAG: AsnC family transcriptional regulator [Actinomycetota bacterium]